MALEINIERENNKFRLITQEFSIDWLPDTIANKEVMIVLLRKFEAENGKKLFSYQELSKILNNENRQASNNHVRKFERRDEDFYKMLKYKCKVDEEIVGTVQNILQKEPLLTRKKILEKVSKILTDRDISLNNIQLALERISYKEIRGELRKQLENGKIHYKEQEVIDSLFEIANESLEKKKQAKKLENVMIEDLKATHVISSKSTKEDVLKLPENVDGLFKGDITSENLSRIWNTPMGWMLWTFLLYYNGISLSVIGAWMGVNKSTPCRWLSKIANWSHYWVNKQRVSISMNVAIDEKWIKIAGEWWYLFVAIDCVTRYPLHVAIYQSNSKNYCKLFLLELKKKGYNFKVIITDGWDAYLKPIKAVFPNAQHLLCQFHVIQSVFRRFRKAKIFDSAIARAIGKIFKTRYKRTAQRRIEKVKKKLKSISKEHVLYGVEAKLPQVLPAIGSTWRPTTSNAVETFFSQFSRFYKLKGPFNNRESAEKHINLFLLGYILTIGAKGQPCPLEKASSDVAQLPIYHLINKPDIIALKDRMSCKYKIG